MSGGAYLLPTPPFLPGHDLPPKSMAQPTRPWLVQGELRSSASVGHRSIQVDSVPGLAPDGCNPEIAREPVCSAGRSSLVCEFKPSLPCRKWDLTLNQ